jgi:hypothetical protein
MHLTINATNGNNHSLDNNSTAAPNFYLGSISGLGSYSGSSGGGLINQAGKSTLQIRKPNHGGGAVVSDYQTQGDV